MSVYQYYKDLPTWAKGVTVVGAGVGIFFGYKELKKYQDKRKAQQAAAAFLQTIQSDIDKSEKVRPATKVETNYRQLADALHKALNQYNTDESGVYRVFAQMNNDTDVLKLVKAFGMRLNTTGLMPEAQTLNAFIADVMNADEINQINYLLAGKAIKYRV